MKLSEFIKLLYEVSPDVNSVADLAECTGISKGFIDRMFAGKNTFEKADEVCEYLTHDFDANMVIEAMQLIRTIRFLDEGRRIRETSVNIDLEAARQMTQKEQKNYIQQKIDEANALGQ